jgi:hypothetical protein
LEKQEAVLTSALAKLSYPLEDVRLLMTLPGVGATVAQVVVAALGDWRRFKDADHAASYLGLVPTVRQSAEHCHHGSITKVGNSHARWLLVQAAQHVSRHPGPLGVFFRRLVRRKHHNVAVVATARKLVTVAYHMLKHREPYRYALPARTQLKLSALRVAATGKRRRKGKVAHPLQPQQPGIRRRRTPELNAIYHAEGLQAVATAPTSPGEQRVISICGGEKLLAKIHQPSTRLSRCRTPKTLTHLGETTIQSSPSQSGPEKERGITAPSLAQRKE